ncbi:hypothetical protein LWC05_16955 [Acetobacter sicerae]|uniref:Uncharacterized protein n=1 Tax=Acetobacter sicerae TaxID=85325 RepID=A0ABS8W003_9PROT|nr:hypothetical protein [Acetobacter sicerae]MCE0745561.1 hypothetical protein [Acetobacter sicerae]
MTCDDPRYELALAVASILVEQMSRLIPAGVMSPELKGKVEAAVASHEWFLDEADRALDQCWLDYQRSLRRLVMKGGEPC